MDLYFVFFFEGFKDDVFVGELLIEIMFNRSRFWNVNELNGKERENCRKI